MNDQQIEQDIQAKGLTAPRVTPSDLKQNIVDEFYFTAAQAIQAETGIPANSIDMPQGVKLLTFCVLVLRNGFTVTGESACASPENFDAELGRKIARENAVNKVWPLMGYALKEQLHILNQVPGYSERLDAHIKMVKDSGWAPGDGAGQQSSDMPPSLLAAHSTAEVRSYLDRLRAINDSNPHITVGEGASRIVLDLATVDAELILRGDSYGKPRYHRQATALMERTKSA